MLFIRGQYRESSRLASEYTTLVEAIGDPTLTVGLSWGSINAKYEAGGTAEALRLAQRVIDLADGDPAMGDLLIGSPLAIATALRGSARACLGLQEWKADLDRAVAMARAADPMSYALCMLYKYGPIGNGALVPDAAALREAAEAVQIAEQSGDDLGRTAARVARGMALTYRHGPESEAGFELLANAREMAMQRRFSMTAVPMADVQTAKEKLRTGDVDGAIGVARSVIDGLLDSGEMIWHGPATTVLVESLLARGADGDLREAQAAMDRLAAMPTDPGFVLHELPLLRLRALLARAHGDEAGYRSFADRYRTMANDVGFEGHIAIAEAMM